MELEKWRLGLPFHYDDEASVRGFSNVRGLFFLVPWHSDCESWNTYENSAT